MPPINIRKALYIRAVKHGMEEDLTTVLNDYVEKLLDEKDSEG